MAGTAEAKQKLLVSSTIRLEAVELLSGLSRYTQRISACSAAGQVFHLVPDCPSSTASEAQRQLLMLIDAPEPGTRYWVASFALAFAPDEGERVLAELAKTPKSFVGFTAGVALEQWKAGTFKPA
ncbi:MAG TPA: hypothetical protein VEU33_47765 [Archangium sp.]|nr:hypothetical protein [Archangium sp.]